MTGDNPTGVLLIQLGTPDSTSVRDVRRYLREFLGDPRVLDMSAPARALLLNLVILPFRPRRSAEQYRKIWTKEGSPLLIHSNDLANAVQTELGDDFRVVFGMRYQNPPIASALDELVAAGCVRVVVVPLFPQYASAAYGSAAARALEIASTRWNVPEMAVVGPFYDDPGFVDSVAGIAAPLIEDFDADHVLLSYHGLPEQQIMKSDPTGDWCLTTPGCCDTIEPRNAFCYRAQSFATTRNLAQALGLADGEYSTSFQSRLKGQKWIEPYTDGILADLRNRGVKRLAVLTPSFVADCLETIEEIGMRLRDQWADEGGEDLLLVPCVNADRTWAAALASLVRRTPGSDGYEEPVGRKSADAHAFAGD